MSEEELKEAIEILKKPVIVQNVHYHYFDQENYNNLLSTYDKCLWYFKNFQPYIKQLQQENKELKEQLKMCKEFNEGLENHIKKLNDVLARMPLDKTLMQCVIDTYKARIDKAIEYINNLEYFVDNDEDSNDSYYKCNNIDELLQTLKGDK